MLQSELNTLIAAYAGGRAVTLPSAASYRDCVEAVLDHARAPEVLGELDHWRAQPWEHCVDLPLDGPAPTADTPGRWISRHWPMSGPDVRTLVTRLPGQLGVDLSDVVLAAVAETLTRQSGGGLAVRTVHHGRNLRRAGPDPGSRVPVLPRRSARTVGWLSTFGGVALLPRTDPDAARYLRGVGAQLTAAPNRGTGLSLLRYLTPPGGHTDLVTRVWRQAQVLFNFGGVGTRPAGDEVLGVADEEIGHRPDPMEPRLSLHIRGYAADDTLTIMWDHDPWSRTESTITALAEQTEKNLLGYVADLA
jgi:non-ribosomal peptide synthase protein (TIGR01720 family)